MIKNEFDDFKTCLKRERLKHLTLGLHLHIYIFIYFNEFHSLIVRTLNVLPPSVFLLYQGKLKLRLQK